MPSLSSEVQKNTVMEEENNNTQQEQQETTQSFCEALMNATYPLKDLQQPQDSALIMCTNGKELLVRMCGSAHNIRFMLFAKCLQDPIFAKAIIETAAVYNVHQIDPSVTMKYHMYESEPSN